MPTETLEAPAGEVTTSNTPDEGYQMPEGLRNLLDRVLPEGSDTGEQVEPDPEPVEEQPEEKVEKEPEVKPEPKKAAAKAFDTTVRLAPDLSAKPEEKVEPEPDIEITEEMIKAEKNPKKQADMRKLGKALDRYRTENAELKAKTSAPVEDTGQQAMIEDRKRSRRTRRFCGKRPR
jgi:hypothetical protein